MTTAEAQNWYYIKRQEASEVFILKIFDSVKGEAEFSPHTGVDAIYGADGVEVPRESIEVRLIVCYL